MQKKKRTPLDAQQSHLWIIGGGIAGMAAAAFAIRDAKVPAKNIHILEELDISGGSMDGGHTPHAAQAWVTRGGRMLTDETYLCLWDLFSSIPSLENPDISVREECRKKKKLAVAALMSFLMKPFLKPISGACGARLSLFKNGTVQQS